MGTLFEEAKLTESIPKPENTGDIYRVEGYRGMLAPHYGWVYKDSNPDALEGSWCWWIEMDDGDLYPWMDGEEMPRMDASRVELVRRNPLPDWEQEVPNVENVQS